MATMVLMAALLFYLSTETLSIQVIVPETERSTALFASVILRCDYSTSANPQEVLVTWRYKSFCKDPVLEYYSTAYQAALQLGQDPANDCPDRQRTLRTVIQKRGSNEAMLGSEYRERKITMQNKADLVITEVMWWDNGVYFCSIDAPGDTTGDSDREVKLIVYLVMQHRMLRDAQKAMTPWLHGQPIYAPISSNVSSQGNPILYSGSISDHPAKQNFAMAPMGLSPVPFQQQAPPPPPPHRGSHRNTSAHGSVQETNQVLDYLESQMRGMDGGALQMPLHSVQHLPPMAVAHPPQPLPHTVPFTSRPPSMLSALDEMGLRGVERRVITLPPIVQHGYSLSPRRGDRGGERARGDPRISSQSSGSSNRTGVGGGGGRRHRDPRGHRNPSPPQHGLLRGYSDDSEWESQRNGGARGGGRPERGGSAGRRGGGTRPRSRSRDDLMEDLRRVMPRRDRSYSPPLRRQGSWSSDDDDSRRGRGGKGREWSEKPPSYSSIELKPGRSNGRRTYDRFSDRSSRSGTSVVI
ncbi:immunoglobulin-like domain-containing receptor 1a isoform X2 [Lampris incognitus]|uniref:immunoglobulin-like domain-containing receptor 1a isoform X2 n=1 Tax=Lampris incognitus TaxID=2546036 RepID=UPI0024B57039|nr:immunoglobulin-like domain-containing receptor 1a isoform X2 [Lampris incognitus]